MIRRRTITSYVWNSVSGNKMVILSNCIRNFFRKFELSGNSTQGENPSPDNPQEIKSAGRKSKNLFNIADLRVGQVQKDGTINEKQIYYRTVILDVPQDGKYRITFNSNDDYTMLYFTEAYANEVYSNPYLRVHAGSPNYYITLAKGKNILSFSTHTASGNIAFTTDHNIMIAAESETLDYEPYGYFFDVKVTRKNLLNLQKEPDVKGVYQGWKVGDGEKTIVLSIKDKGNNVDITKCSIGVSGNGINPNDGLGWIVQDGVIKRSEIKTINPYVSIYPPNETSVQKFLERFDIQAEYGEIATSYEPYTEQSVQIALDEPLRGIGEYKDVLTKDGVVRKIKRIVFDGSEDEKWGIGIERENVIDFVSTQFSDATKINEHQRSMMDKLKWSSGVWGRDEIGQDMFARILRINMPKTLAPDLQTFKTWLSQNPLTVDYVLAEPVTEPLPESVQAQLQALHSENGVTHVFVDSGEVPCGINIEYKYKS